MVKADSLSSYSNDPYDSSSADEERPPIDIQIKAYSILGKIYNVAIVDVDPMRPLPKSLEEDLHYVYGVRSYADFLLRRAAKYLRKVHLDFDPQKEEKLIGRVILDSLEKPARESDQVLHKVDDYFERKSVTIIITRENDISDQGIVATVKFVESDLERAFGPSIGDYDEVFNEALIEEMNQAPGEETVIEFESLGKSQGIPSPVDFAFFEALNSGFFDFLRRSELNGPTYLNSETHILPYHTKNLGWTEIKSYYGDLPAHKLGGTAREFYSVIEGHYQTKYQALEDGKTVFLPHSPPLYVYRIGDNSSSEITDLISTDKVDPSDLYKTYYSQESINFSCEELISGQIRYY